MKPYLFIIAMFYCYWSEASCMLYKIPIEDRTRNAPSIIEGQVLKQQSHWNADHSSIFTVNTVQVANRLKGNPSSTIEVITPGGELDGRLLVVNPNADLQTGSSGIFFLQPSHVTLDYTTAAPQYEIYSLAQGFIEEDPYTGKYRDPFDTYDNRTILYSLIGKTSGNNYRMGNTPSAYAVSSGKITSFSPTTITAGTQSVLTITGTGFGTRTALSTVQFRDANSVIPSTCVSVPDASYILSWTDTEIKVIVPGASAFRQGGAGSGTFNVIDGNGGLITSSTPLTITYNQFEYKTRRVDLIGQNGLGGYTFTLNDNFNANGNAKAAFLRALNQWTCTTGVNAIVSSSTSSTTCNNQIDNINIVSFADASCPLPAGALGTTYSSYSLCNNSPIMPDGMDMIFSPDANFYEGTGTPASNQYDFESAVLHELGHAFGQGHNSNANEVMYPSIANGFVRRNLSASSDIANIKDVINRSVNAGNICGFLKYVTAAPCAAGSIAANFIADRYTGCAPLTINFTDKTTGNPTQWKWDIGNDGSIDFTTQNPSYTFTKSGYYAVKLVASNNSGKDSIVKNIQIYVSSPVNLTVTATQNVTCNGGNNGSLYAMATGGDGNYSYTWNNNQSTSTINNLTAGTYNVSVKDGSNCKATANGVVTQPDPISVNVTTQLTGNSYNAILNISGGTLPYTYTLNNSSGSRLESNTQTISNLTAGNYTLSVKDKNNCSQVADFVMSSPTGISTPESQFDKLDVYPNPAVNDVHIDINLKEEKTVQVEMIDLAGNTVYKDEYSNIKDKQASLDLSAFASGTYILRFGLPEGNTFKKIIINR